MPIAAGHELRPTSGTPQAPQHLRGLSTTHPGLGYVGLEWQRSLASASLRGVGRDADYVIRRLVRPTSDRTRFCAALGP
jgi:hypothetical protein